MKRLVLIFALFATSAAQPQAATKKNNLSHINNVIHKINLTTPCPDTLCTFNYYLENDEYGELITYAHNNIFKKMFQPRCINSSLTIINPHEGQPMLVQHAYGTPALLTNRLTITGDNRGVISIYQSDNRYVSSFQAHRAGITALTLTPENFLVTGASDGSIKIWDLDTQSLLTALQPHSARVSSLLVTDNGEIISGSHDGTIVIWNYYKDQLDQLLTEHQGPVTTLALLDSGRFISGSTDGQAFVWDILDDEPLRILNHHKQKITAALMLTSGLVATASENVVHIWNAERGIYLYSLPTHHGNILHLNVSDEGTLLVQSEDNTIQEWSVPTINCCNFEPLELLLAIKLDQLNKANLKSIGLLHKDWDTLYHCLPTALQEYYRHLLTEQAK